MDWLSYVCSQWSFRRPSSEFCNSPFLLAQKLRNLPLTNEKSFSSPLLKLCQLGQNACGWNPSFIGCPLRGNTSGQFKKALETETGFWDGGWESDWKDHGNKTIFNFFKKLSFDLMFGFGMVMVIVFVPISWTTGLFLRYFSFGKIETFQMLPCSSHLIILILTPLLGSGTLVFLKVPLAPHGNAGTVSKPRRRRKYTLLAKLAEPKGLHFCVLSLPIFILFSHLNFSSLRGTLPSVLSQWSA